VWVPETSEPSSEFSPAPGNLGDAEVGPLDHGAGQAVDLRLLHVDQELLGGPRRSLRSAVALVATSAVPEMASTNASGASHRSAGREVKIGMRTVFLVSPEAR
jgi:hypothetical protein